MRPARSGSNLEVDPTVLTLVITGNRVEFAGGMQRRVVEIRLGRQPSGKEYRFPNFDRAVLAHRPEILAALLWAVKEWLRRGRPEPNVALPSFPGWSKIVGGIVAVAYEAMSGSMAPGEGLEAVEQWLGGVSGKESAEDADWRVLFEHWQTDSEGGFAALPARLLLQQADDLVLTYIMERVAAKDAHGRRSKAGKYFRQRVETGRIVDGLRLTQSRGRNGALYVPVPVDIDVDAEDADDDQHGEDGAGHEEGE